uniref:Uncharacterized protein n=1 Tax=Parascaris univalens TaxID=6257 RepID=A0A915B5L1_PARUN
SKTYFANISSSNMGLQMLSSCFTDVIKNHKETLSFHRTAATIISSATELLAFVASGVATILTKSQQQRKNSAVSGNLIWLGCLVVSDTVRNITLFMMMLKNTNTTNCSSCHGTLFSFIELRIKA